MTPSHRGMVVAVEPAEIYQCDTILRAWRGVASGRLTRVVLRRHGERRVLRTYRRREGELAGLLVLVLGCGEVRRGR